MIIGILVGLFVVLVTVVVVRTLRVKPVPDGYTTPEPCDVDMDAAVRALQAMIRIPTISHKDESLVDTSKFRELHALLASLFPKVHQTCEVQKFDKAILYRWPAATAAEKHAKEGGSSDGAPLPILLMSHLDVVPPGDPALWTHGAFSGEIHNGELWGRGAVDTKVTALGALFGLETAIARGRAPERDIYLSLSSDEEVQGRGALAVLAYLQQRGIHLDLVLDEGGAVMPHISAVGGSNIAFVGIAEKSYCDIRISAESSGGHASMPPDHTALGRVAQAIALCEAHPYAPRVSEPLRRMLCALGPRLSFVPRMLCANLWLFGPLAAHACARWLPQASPLRAMLRTTAAWTMAAGAEQANILPKHAHAVVNFRLLAPETPEDAKRRVEALVAPLGVKAEVITAYVPDPVSESQGPLWDAVAATAKDVWGRDTVVSPFLVVGSTDSAHFSRARICPRVYRFSPIAPDTTLMHNIDERIPITSVHNCVEFYVRFIERFTSK